MKVAQAKQLYLAGIWTTTADTVTIHNPYTDEVLAAVCQASLSELSCAMAAASSAVATFQNTLRSYKSQLCQTIADGICDRADELASLISRESGKPIQYAMSEVKRAVTTFSLAAHEALRLTGEIIPLDITPTTTALSGHTVRVPKGPVAAIAPFNFPLNLVAHKIAPALAAGCPIILKPAPQTPLTALALAEIIHTAGVPQGVVSVLPMETATAEIMVRDDRMKVLSFTGSAPVGWHLKSIAGKKFVLLELGGNAPAIVHSDADIPHAVAQLVVASFAAAGQVCIKSQRLILHADIAEEFMEQFTTLSRQIICGDPLDPSTVVGPVIDSKSADRIEAWVSKAEQAGATVLLRGQRQGNVLTPTILTNVPSDEQCRNEEIFGPVVIVDKYQDFDEAVYKANDSNYGLQAAVFTFDVRIINKAIQKLEYGGIIFNDSPMIRVDNFPYGGTKASGFGREGVYYAMQEFTQDRMIVYRTIS